jgi:hypothetical protein
VDQIKDRKSGLEDKINVLEETDEEKRKNHKEVQMEDLRILLLH